MRLARHPPHFVKAAAPITLTDKAAQRKRFAITRLRAGKIGKSAIRADVEEVMARNHQPVCYAR